MGSRNIKRTSTTVQFDTGTHINKNTNQLGKPVYLKKRPKTSTADPGVRWKRLQEWPKGKAASHSEEWNSVYEEPKMTMTMCQWLMWLLVVVAGTYFTLFGMDYQLCSKKRGSRESPETVTFPLCPCHIRSRVISAYTAVGTPHMPDTVLGRHVHGLWLVILYITYSSFYTQNRADVPFPSVP